MQSEFHRKEKKLVPRFRRKNANNNLIDADDEEAQALIEKDLQSHFIWTSDTTDGLEKSHQFDNEEYEENNQQISIIDDFNQESVYDIDNNQQELWKNNIELNDQQIKWTHDQQQNKISLNIHSIQDKQQQWSLYDKNHKTIQFNLIDHDNQQYKHDLDNNNNDQKQTFIQGDEFLNKMKFAIQSDNEQLNIFPDNSEDLRLTTIDTNIPSKDSILSLPQAPIILHWIEGISQYTLSLPDEKISEEYSPLTQIKNQLDSNSLKALRWSLDLLKENLIVSYLLSLPNNLIEQLSIPDKFNLKLSIDEDNNKQQLFSIIDLSFKQTISYSSNDIKQQLLTIIDLIQIKQNFGYDEKNLLNQWSLHDFKILVQNLSPEEIINYLYSPEDVQPISYQQILIDSDEISARAFRRYRCKHMSIKVDDKDQLDSSQGLNLLFKGNEQIAIGEQYIQNDFDQQQIYRDLTNCEILLEDDLPQSYDITTSDCSPSNLGPCLFRLDYEREPPKTWSRLRREIGYISYDASLHQPTYYLDKSFKRYVHIPKKRDQCSYNVYRGYEEFKEHARLNPENYFRPHDGTDLRPLLHWYTQKQHLFSSTKPNMLKPPTFICRRLVLRTILANLYCDSEPWKLLVVRIKGQFHLALANKATRHVENMTEDEYSGYKFEELFTTKQPNSTRFQEEIPIKKPQEQFHNVHYWQFGEFNILYSNEIDGEITNDMIPKTETIDLTKQEDNVTSTEEAESKTVEMDENLESTHSIPSDVVQDWWSAPVDLTGWNELTTLDENEMDKPIEDEWKVAQINENLELTISDENEMGQPIEDEWKVAQINENLQLITSDENETDKPIEGESKVTQINENETIEKKRRDENEIKAGYVEMKCTNKKIFYRDENKLQTLHWWAQMWLANTNTLMIGYKTSNIGNIDHLDLFTIQKLISKFLSRYDLNLKYCLSYLYSFLNLIQQTVNIDDPNTIHAFAYIPQPLEIDPLTGKPVDVDLPQCVPFRYTQIKRSNQRHANFIPEWYFQHIQRTIPIGGILQDTQLKTVEEETKKRIGHRGRSTCILKQQQQQKFQHKRKRKQK
ncbi:unnamed protein product [Adineta steineri]|uniref:RAI1-like domain-containing protein n=2 Tax=Adineta steineri TaxID=433720 RepID=A0A819U983_9BILA|nr:unnamed protein product [Adineta steineri]CAF4090938.1 unnamed protein product [Adineta steineri]